MKWLNDTLVKSPVDIALCTEPSEFWELIDSLGIPDDQRPECFIGPSADASVWQIENKDLAVCIVTISSHFKDYNRVAQASVLCHESVHIWQMIREMIGEESPSEEFEAYSIQGIFYKLMKEYRKREKKSKRDAQLKKEQEDKANKQAFEEDLKT